ncbi:MAG: LysR family transcriptional regulator [Candidatus Hodarchaeota archaeon]
MTKDEIKPRFKIWLEFGDRTILGVGGAMLLQLIKDKGSLAAAAEALSISYRHAWNQLKKIEERLGKPVVERFKGGFRGGGGMWLTNSGKRILKKFQRFNVYIEYALQNPELWEAYGLRTKERNRIKGKIVEVKKDAQTASIKIKVESPVLITSIITEEAVENLDLTAGANARVIIKATEIMIDKRGI